MNMRTTLYAFFIGFFFAASYSFAQVVTANQGSPGNQGAWPVRFETPTFPSDGGLPSSSTSVAVYPYPCATSSPNKIVYMDAGVQNTPSTSATRRLYTVVCNSRENISGNLKCRADGTNPTTATGSAGDVLGVGDCVPYTNPSGFPVKCIGSNLYVTTYECVR